MTCGLCPNTPLETETVIAPVAPVAVVRAAVDPACNDRYDACSNSAWTSLCGHNRQVGRPIIDR